MVGLTDVTALANELTAHTQAIHRGDMRPAEALLIAQANTLQVMFYELARRAGTNMGENLQATDTYMRLALKAQSQCRATIETLAVVKNPPAVAFVKQANIAAGHQQVNNGEAPARGNPFQSNELLEPHEQLEHRTPQAAGIGDTALATLGEIDRTKVEARQGPSKSKRTKARSEIP